MGGGGAALQGGHACLPVAVRRRKRGIITHMLAQYLDAAMRSAQYEYLPEDGVYYGEIPPLAGVWATGKTLEDCQRELREVLEEWVALRQQWNQALPILEGVSLTQAV